MVQRSQKTRTDGWNMLVDGSEADGTYGLMGNYAAVGGTLGSWEPGGDKGSFWVGQDDDHRGDAYFGIGPNGPGEWGGQPYAYDSNYGGLRHGWWNRPHNGKPIPPAVTRCTTVIVNPIITTKWVMETPTGPKPMPLWITDPMLKGSVPGPIESTIPAAHRLSGSETWETVLTHALWYGRGAVVFMESADGTPQAGTIHVLNPFMLCDKGGYWAIGPNDDEQVETDFDGRFRLGAHTWRVAVMRGLPPHDHHNPSGVLQRIQAVLGLVFNIGTYASGTFSSGVPSGYLSVSTPNMDQKTADMLKDNWMKAHGSGKRSVAVLNAVTSYTPISIKPVDADVDKIKRLTDMDIAHAFGLSSAWLDTGDATLKYENSPAMRRDLVDITAQGWASSLMEMLSSLMPYGTYFRINWSSFQQGDLPTVVPPLNDMYDRGIISMSEYRQRVGYEPTADMDTSGAQIEPMGTQQDPKEVVDAESV
jgi:phage portal protein BeeE